MKSRKAAVFDVKSQLNKRRVFVHDKNWNMVTTMITGIQKSLAIVQSEPHKMLSSLDFKVHNKLEVEAVLSTAFNRCKFKDYAPFVFQSIRGMFGISHESYIKSIGFDTLHNTFFDKLQLMLFENSSGKSGSFFFHTSDSKFMIKTVRKRDFKTLMSILYNYYAHLQKHPRTLLVRFFGLHELKCFRDKRLINDIFIVVMNNVLDISNKEALVDVFDIKGSSFDRKTTPAAIEKGLPKKESNFLEEYGSLVVNKNAKLVLCSQLQCDSEFLASRSIIDYSLLVSVVQAEKDGNRTSAFYNKSSGVVGKLGNFVESIDGKHHYYVGMIDMLMHFGPGKYLEYLAKRVVLRHDFSCIPPEPY